MQMSSFAKQAKAVFTAFHNSRGLSNAITAHTAATVREDHMISEGRAISFLHRAADVAHAAAVAVASYRCTDMAEAKAKAHYMASDSFETHRLGDEDGEFLNLALQSAI